jgi:hypothetical protein
MLSTIFSVFVFKRSVNNGTVNDDEIDHIRDTVDTHSVLLFTVSLHGCDYKLRQLHSVLFLAYLSKGTRSSTMMHHSLNNKNNKLHEGDEKKRERKSLNYIIPIINI